MPEPQHDPPDEPIEPPMRLILGSILSCLPELTPRELYLLKGAVADAQEEPESRAVLEGQGIL